MAFPNTSLTYYCRFCGHKAYAPMPGCAKCGSTIPLREF
jgi:ribosomal protein L37E